MELIGRVLWWCDHDENGIIVDKNGNEFYFDRSVLKLKSNQSIKRKIKVTFKINESIKDCLCAHEVHILTATKRKIIEPKIGKEPLASI